MNEFIIPSRVHVVTKRVLWPVIWLLFKMDRRPEEFGESTMLVGRSAKTFKLQ